MAEKWYPLVDFTVCIECGDCANSCPKSVYDISKSHTPVVSNPITAIPLEIKTSSLIKIFHSCVVVLAGR